MLVVFHLFFKSKRNSPHCIAVGFYLFWTFFMAVPIWVPGLYRDKSSALSPFGVPTVIQYLPRADYRVLRTTNVRGPYSNSRCTSTPKAHYVLGAVVSPHYHPRR